MNTDPELTQPLRSTDADPVEALLARCLEEAEGDFQPAFDRMLAEHPEHADELVRCYEALVDLGMVGEGSEAALPERIGEFVVKGRLGGGGMGVVYLAEQESLGREIALKIVRPETLYFPGARERFLREARALASLQHPGIVPVHTVDTEGSIPFYAMERIRGVTLGELLHAMRGEDASSLRGADLHRAIVRGSGVEVPAETPLPAIFEAEGWRTIIDLVRQVAEALAHCHGHGVLHRDVKPTNVMVTPEGRALLFDFGLARAPGALKLTRTGTEMGSLAYMAPEQFNTTRHEPDERTDVYGLGVTLYEMLTQVHPFAAADSESTRRRILSGEVTSPRRLHRGLPWEVETVCLVAMDRDPSRRYRSAEHLAADLRAILEGRAITARRPGLMVGLGRWIQRHPTTTVALALGSLLLVGGPLLYAWQSREAELEVRGALGRVEASEARARRDRERAVNSLRAATDAVERLLVRIAEESLFNQAHLQPLRGHMLAEASAVYDGLLVEEPEDPKLRLEAVRALNRRAHIATFNGEYDAAAVAFEAGTESVLELMSVSAIAERARSELAWLWLQRARVEDLRHRLDAALVALENARRTVRSLAPEARAASPALQMLAVIEKRAASILNRQDRIPEARAALDELQRVLVAWRATGEDLFRADFLEAEGLEISGIVASRAGDYELAGEALRGACEKWRRLGDVKGDQVRVRERVAGSLITLGRHIYAMKGPEAALPHLLEGVEAWETLSREYHPWVHPRFTLVMALRYFADAMSDLGDARALESYQRSLELSSALIADAPEHMGAMEEVAYVRRRLMIWHARKQEYEPAIAQAKEAVTAWRRIVALRPALVSARCELGVDLGNLAAMMSRAGRPEAAVTIVEEAIEKLVAGVAEAPNTAFFKSALVSQFVILSEAHLVTGDFEAAVKATERLAALDLGLPQAALRIAEVHARAVARLRREDPQAELLETWTERALAALGRAVDQGLQDLALFERNPATRLLRGRPEVDALRARLSAR